jgi:hypothetical protein
MEPIPERLPEPVTIFNYLDPPDQAPSLDNYAYRKDSSGVIVYYGPFVLS